MMKTKGSRKESSRLRTFLMWLVCCGSTQLKKKESSHGRRARLQDSPEIVGKTDKICKSESYTDSDVTSSITPSDPLTQDSWSYKDCRSCTDSDVTSSITPLDPLTQDSWSYKDCWSCTDSDVTSSITPSDNYFTCTSDPLTPESEPRSAQLDLCHDKWAYLDGPEEFLDFELWDYGVDVHPEQRHRAKWEVTDKHGNVLYEGTMFPTSS